MPRKDLPGRTTEGADQMRLAIQLSDAIGDIGRLAPGPGIHRAHALRLAAHHPIDPIGDVEGRVEAKADDHALTTPGPYAV